MQVYPKLWKIARGGWHIIFLLACVSLQAQQYSFQYFGVEQGLTNLGIKTLFQDRTGFIWLVTENGVFRYEGVRFLEFSPEKGLPASFSASLGDLSDGSVLVGNQSGLFRARGERFEPVPMLVGKRVNGYNGIVRDGKTTWVATDIGLFQVTLGRDGTAVAEPGPKPLDAQRSDAHSVLVENHSVLWGCGRTLCRSTRTEAGNWQTEDIGGARAGLEPMYVAAILRDRDGDLWIWQNRRLLRLPHGGSKFEPVPDLPPLGIGSFIIDSGGRLLVPTTEGLVIRENGRFRTIGRSAGLLPPAYSVMQDREGSVWIGLAGRGLAKWRGYNEWESFTAQSGLTSETVYEILPMSDGGIFVGTENGLFHGARQGPEWVWRQELAPGQTPVHSVRLARDGRLWLGTDGKGVALLDPRTKALKWFRAEDGLGGHSPNSLLVDAAGRLWAGTERGIFVLDPGAKTFRPIPEVSSVRCWTITQAPNGDVWAGAADGLWLFSADKWRRFTMKEGLKSNSVLAIAPDDKGAWIGYRLSGTVSRLDWSEGAKPVIKELPVLPGPVSTITYFLNYDPQGRLWIGTNFGVQVLSASRTKRERLDHRDGLVWDDCDLHSFATEPDGHIWIGTSGGLSRFLPQPSSAPPDPPRALLTSALFGKTELDPTRYQFLDYSSDPLVIRFTALRFGRDRDLEFRYMLKPVFTTWRETQERELNFPALPPGSYRFEVQARDSGGQWGAVPAAFEFQVKAPWWRTWWFIGGSSIGLVVLVGIWVHRRSAHEESLRRALEHAVAERTRELSHQYRHDVLTGLPNRLFFGERLNRELISAGLAGQTVAVLFIDLDRFKRINDTWGHRIGDIFLRQIAARLRSGLQQDEMIARIGGDEFTALIPNLRDKREAEVRGWDLMRLLDDPIQLEDKTVFATMSIGIAVFPTDASDSTALMAAADAAMYRAKAQGKNQVQVFVAGMMDAASRPQDIEDRLRHALQARGFFLRYQPQYSLDGTLQGFEALLRLIGNEKEITPGEFIPIAEETGLITEIGAWVLREACQQGKRWHDAGFPHIRIAVNVSVVQLVAPSFEGTLTHVLQETGLEPGRLELELTETALLKDAGSSAGLLARIRKLGVHVALDDFGTGFSPMQFLHQLPVDAVKIDRVFVRDLEGKSSSVPLVEGMVKLARTLRLRVVAEGVETLQQLQILRKIGVDAAQGNLLSLPVTADQAQALLRNPVRNWP